MHETAVTHPGPHRVLVLLEEGAEVAVGLGAANVLMVEARAPVAMRAARVKHLAKCIMSEEKYGGINTL